MDFGTAHGTLRSVAVGVCWRGWRRLWSLQVIFEYGHWWPDSVEAEILLADSLMGPKGYQLSDDP